MMPNEYMLNKEANNLEELTGIKIADKKHKDYDVLQIAIFLVLAKVSIETYSQIGNSINLLTGLNLETPLDVVEYFLKSLDRIDFLRWSDVMLESEKQRLQSEENV